MNILLINKNIVVSKLVSIAIKELDASLEEIDSISKLHKDSYDVVIVDDSANALELDQSIEQILARYKVALYNLKEPQMSYYDAKVKKPFLPHDLTTLLLTKFQQHSLISSTQEIPQKETKSDDIVAQLLTLEPQKIKEILAGAKVTITIDFPKDVE